MGEREKSQQEQKLVVYVCVCVCFLLYECNSGVRVYELPAIVRVRLRVVPADVWVYLLPACPVTLGI